MIYLTTFMLICMLNLSQIDSTVTPTTPTSTYRKTFYDYKRNETPASLFEYLNLISNENNSNNKELKCLNERKNELNLIVNDQVQIDLLTHLTSKLFDYLEKCFSHDHSHHDHDHNDHDHDESMKQPSASSKSKEWFFAFLSATIITVIGLLCYIVVPSLNACCFNYLFQFLVALAVGSLCGDALLHLIPHAFTNHSHGEDTLSHRNQTGNNHTEYDMPHKDHNEGVYKGLAAITGIYIFFLIEKIMHMRRARKEKRHRQTELAISESEHDLLRNVTNNTSNLNLNQLVHVVETSKVDNHILSSSAPLVVNAISGTNKIYTNEPQQQQQQQQQVQKQLDTLSDEQSCLVIHANKDLKYISQYLPNNKCTENVDHHDHENEIEHKHQHSNQPPRLGLTSSADNNNNNNDNNNNNLTNQLIISNNSSTNINNLTLIKPHNHNNSDNKIPNDILINEDTSKNKLFSEQTSLLMLDTNNDANNNQCACTATTTPTTTTTTTPKLDGDDMANGIVVSLNSNSTLCKKDAHHQHSHHSLAHKEHQNKKQQHGHSHIHKYKSSREKAHHDHHKKHEKEISDIKLIAWMVIMGDGLHNFSDGLAIGTSFASSLPIGFGTAIAVLCHELPHEIGDFAVLRKAGVSLKRALVFNLVSGVLCLLGVLVGLLIGGIEYLSSWAFLFIAGTFLYISLVDMIPELCEDKEDDSVKNFLIQSFGILVGIGVMLVIALLEESIIKLFN